MLTRAALGRYLACVKLSVGQKQDDVEMVMKMDMRVTMAKIPIR